MYRNENIFFYINIEFVIPNALYTFKVLNLIIVLFVISTKYLINTKIWTLFNNRENDKNFVDKFLLFNKPNIIYVGFFYVCYGRLNF